jgi:hypothetical protein
MKTIVLGVLILIAAPAFAQSEQLLKGDSAEEIAQRCKAVNAADDLRSDFDRAAQMADRLACLNRVQGWRDVIDSYPVLIAGKTTETVQIHIDLTATTGQLIRVFAAYVTAHPAVENRRGILVFIAALEDAGLTKEEPVVMKSGAR